MTELIGFSFLRSRWDQEECEEILKCEKIENLEWNWNYYDRYYRYCCINPNINVFDMEKEEGVYWENDIKYLGMKLLVRRIQ
jgi:hypothetical protein